MVFRAIKSYIDRDINTVGKDLFGKANPFYLAIPGYKNLVFCIEPVFSGNLSTVLVDVSGSIAYIGLDIHKAFSFLVTVPRLGQFVDYKLGSETVRKDIRKFLELEDSASEVDVLKKYKELNDSCLKKAEEFSNGNFLVQFRGTSNFTSMCKLKGNNIKYLPLMGVDYLKNKIHFLCVSNKGYLSVDVDNLSTYTPKNFEYQLSAWLTPILKGANSFPWDNFAYSIDNGKSWKSF